MTAAGIGGACQIRERAMHVIRRRGWEIPERLATPEHVFFNRRAFLAASGAAALAVARGCALRNASPICPTRPRISIRPSATRNSPRPTHDEKINTSYNNFYEFGSSKNIVKAAQALKLRVDRQDRRHGGEAAADRSSTI